MMSKCTKHKTFEHVIQVIHLYFIAGFGILTKMFIIVNTFRIAVRVLLL